VAASGPEAGAGATGAHGGPGASLSWEAGTGAQGHVAAPKLPPPGRRESLS
jgi:hypothetical protein